MIREVDETLVAWLASFVPRARVSFEPPDVSAANGKDVVLRLFLADVREEDDSTITGWTTLRDEEGVAVGRLPVTRRYRFAYLVTAEGPDTMAAHDVLGRVLAGTAMDAAIPARYLSGALDQSEQPVIVRCAPNRRFVDPTHLWQAWGIAPRTTLELTLLASLPYVAAHEVAAPPSQIEVGTSRIGPSAGAEEQTPRRRPTARIHEG